MSKSLQIGISGAGVIHTDAEDVDVDTRFRWVRDSGAFDYLDRTPPPGELRAYLLASEKYGVPMLSSGWFYVLGRDEALLEHNLRIAQECGAINHNVQIQTEDSHGVPVTNEQVAECYLRAAELGDRLGVTPCFEVHINMWSEHFGRVEQVGALVERRGVKFNITLDHSHVIFKIDNPKEQQVQGLNADVESGRVVLDPAVPGNVCSRWIEANLARQMHARPVIPNNPLNRWARHPDGSIGRGVQYPFVKPEPGEWYDDWDEARLSPWKSVVTELLRHHALSPDSCLTNVTLEMIPFPDYGAGVKYSIFDNNVACARWIREEWERILASA